MISYVPPESITELLHPFLQHAVSAAPARDRPTIEQQMQWLLEGHQQLYTFPHGCMIVERRETVAGANVLLISGISMAPGKFGYSIRKLAKFLLALAAEWSCDVVETMCFDMRLAKAITTVGGRIEAVSITLGGSSGQ